MKTTKSKRIQLRRIAGYRKPKGAVVCTRPGPYGNPFRVVRETRFGYGAWRVVGPNDRGCVGVFKFRENANRLAVEYFVGWWEEPAQAALRARAAKELPGRDLCCYCKIGDSCHVSYVLLPWAAEVIR